MSDNYLEISPKNLFLDPYNPRFAGTANFESSSKEEAIANTIIKMDPGGFLRLAKDIAQRKGLLKGEILCVVPHSQNEEIYIALDGNRRLTAIKLFFSFLDINQVIPEANLDELKRIKTFFERNRQLLSNNFTIGCAPFKDRDEAQPTLQSRHSGALGGASRQTWGIIHNQLAQKNATLIDIISFVERNSRFSEDEWVEIRKYIMEKGGSVLEYMLKTQEFSNWLEFGLEEITKVKHPYFRQDIKKVVEIFSDIFKDIKEQKVNTRTNSKQRSKYFSEKLDKQKSSNSGDKLYFYKATLENTADCPRINNRIVLYPYKGDLINSNIPEDDNKSTSSNNEQTSRVDNDQKNKSTHITQRGKQGATKPKAPKSKKTLPCNESIQKKLEELDNQKLASLYYSITSISLEDHTPLLTIGVWAFIESLTALIHRKNGLSFADFLNDEKWKKIPGLRDIKNTMKRISEDGNATKHHYLKANYDRDQLCNDLGVINPAIVAFLDEAIRNKKEEEKKSSGQT